MRLLVVVAVCLCVLAFMLFFRFEADKALPSPTVVPSRPLPTVHREVAKKAVAVDPPEVSRLRTLVSKFASQSKAWDVLVAVGDVYRKGAFPRFAPNESMALALYKLAATCPCGDTAGMAQVKYIEARDDSIYAADKKGDALPVSFGDELMRMATDRIKGTPWSAFEKPRMQRMVIPERAVVPGQRAVVPGQRAVVPGQRAVVPGQRAVVPDFLRFLTDTVTTAAPPVVPERTYVRDSQNVHDHSVVAVTRKNLETIGADKAGRADTSAIVTAILENKDMSPTQVSDALAVLEDLGDDTHSGFGVSEKGALAAVWTKIQNEPDDGLKANLVETLGKQLASGVENGHVVCSTGKITRLMGTFDGTGDETLAEAKPLWAVKEELGTLAAKVRDDKVQALDDFQKNAYERGDMPELDELMTTEFTDKATTLYCKELGMKESIVMPIVRMYAEAF
jgi:hypothetical protein